MTAVVKMLQQFDYGKSKSTNNIVISEKIRIYSMITILRLKNNGVSELVNLKLPVELRKSPTIGKVIAAVFSLISGIQKATLGQKCCVHIHGVFPYILLSFEAPVSPEIVEEIRSMINTLVCRRDSRVTSVESAVYSIDTVATKSIYGFYKDEENFIKISFCSPYHVNIVTNALQREAFSNTSFQVYEAHVPYLLQFFIDYSLFGMDLVHLRSVKYRISPRANRSDLYVMDLTVGQIISNTSMLSPLLPSTNVAVECDVFAKDITNIEKSLKNKICNPGLNYIWKDEERRCHQNGLKLETKSSQEERLAPVNDIERGWYKQLRDICKSFKSPVKGRISCFSGHLESTFFNDTTADFDHSISMSDKDIDADLVGHLVYDDDIEWQVLEENGINKSFEGQGENEDTKDMSQPLFSLYNAPDNTARISIHGNVETRTSNMSEDSSFKIRPSCSDDIFNYMEFSEKHEQKTERGILECHDEALNLSPDLFDEDTLESHSSRSSDLFGENSIASGPPHFTFFRSSTFSDLEVNQPTKRIKMEYKSSSLPCCFNNELPAEVRKYSQVLKKKEKNENLKFDEKVRMNNDDQNNSDINPGVLYETDIDDLLTPSGNEGQGFYDNEPSTSTNIFSDIVKRYRKYKKFAENNWITPTYLLPFRRPSDYSPSEEKPIDTNVAEEEKLLSGSSANSVLSKKFINTSLVETWCEPSFFNYSMNKEKLEATILVPEEPLSNPDEADVEVRNLCVLSVETLVFVPEKQRIPDPERDQILGIFCCVAKDICAKDHAIDEEICFLNFCDPALLPSDSRIHCYQTENEAFDGFVAFLRSDNPTNEEQEWQHRKNAGTPLHSFHKVYDPDIVLGYNALRNSLGYIVERSVALGRNLLSELSRYKVDMHEYWRPDVPTFHFDPSPRGRILINVWRALRAELALRKATIAFLFSKSYSLSNVVQTVLSRRFPEYSPRLLTEWILSGNKCLVGIVLRYMIVSSRLNLRVLCQLDFFTRVAEMARVYGIQFTEVLSRGSQFRVESMLLRLARLNRLAAATVSSAQRDAMPSPETLALNMEPETGLYHDPVIVLDFQSLYPSVMIAYNYCFSTCLGRVTSIKEVSETDGIERMQIGALNYTLPVPELIKMLKNDELHISPVGGVFCKKSVRKGLVPTMLEEILNTRIMVKKAIKVHKGNARLTRILEARQLALKLIANVTYGYAAANWSGRMPCVEVADAIVSKGREALESAIALVNSGKYGSARVIYGDTDSLFVLCPDSSRKEAFDIGERIAKDVTMANPNPMKLKLEKIMQPLILETKKRYVGMSYEKNDDKKGIFDAKGIETVRRDTCPLVARILEKALRIVFNGNISALVRYLDLQLSNLDQLPLTEFIFSREYRKHYSETAVVPAKKIAEKRRAINPRDEPEIGERVPYLIVAGPPDSTLISCVREPWEFVRDTRLHINYDYYVQRHILPSLHRALATIPLKFVWHRPIIGDCYGCKAIGVRSWCPKCANDSGKLYSALCEFYEERKLISQMDRACAECLALRGVNVDFSHCLNLSCLVTQKRITLRRSKVTDAVRFHNLSGVEISLLF